MLRLKSCLALALLVDLLPFSLQAAEPALGEPVPTVRLERGDLSVLIRDNSESPRVLSGLDSLFNRKAAPAFDAFDPDTMGASAGLNFEHIISGHANKANAFTPRHGPYRLHRLPDEPHSAVLVRQPEDSPWAVASTLKYTLAEPHYVDFEFRCQSRQPELFGPRGYAVFFFAHYMNDVEEVPIVFRGLEGPGARETWIRAGAPSGHADYNQGGTYRHVDASDLRYDEDHNFKLNLWSYDYPRFTQPFYFGRAANNMVFMLMFDRDHTDQEEIRFSLFKFKLKRHPRPAWDFQYVIHKIEKGREYGFNGRLVWKRFVSEEDCWEEYRNWVRGRQGRASP